MCRVYVANGIEVGGDEKKKSVSLDESGLLSKKLKITYFK